MKRAKEEGSAVLDGRVVRYLVRRSRRARHIRITVHDPRTVRITFPYRCKPDGIPELLESHRRWILRSLDRADPARLLPAPFRVEEGARIPALDLGLDLSLRITDGREGWQVKGSTLEIRVRESSPERMFGVIESWYRSAAAAYLEERISYWAGRMRLVPASVRVKSQRTLWGSCSRPGNLNFNWRILLLSPDCVDYLIVHELAHLKELNHSPRFWRLVGRFCPDIERCKREIRDKNDWLGFPRAYQTQPAGRRIKE